MEVIKYNGISGNVFKYIFKYDNFIVESVLYRYGSFLKRTVICCSVQSGCPVGCSFCGTGKHFIKNLTSNEIIRQIDYILNDNNIGTNSIKKFQIMFMSMGEPLLNWDEVEEAIIRLNNNYPNAQLLLSTIAPKNKFLSNMILLSKQIKNIGLQISVHKSNDADRNLLIPYKEKLNLQEIRDLGTVWWNETGRKPFLNYCVSKDNSTEQDFINLSQLFSPCVFNFTFSVICEKDERLKDMREDELKNIRKFENLFIEKGYNTRVFNPEGQDDIGGGCGQLWYVQKWLKEFSK